MVKKIKTKLLQFFPFESQVLTICTVIFTYYFATFEEGAPNAMTLSLKLSVDRDFDNDYYNLKSTKSIQFIALYKSYVNIVAFLSVFHI